VWLAVKDNRLGKVTEAWHQALAFAVTAEAFAVMLERCQLMPRQIFTRMPTPEAASTRSPMAMRRGACGRTRSACRS